MKRRQGIASNPDVEGRLALVQPLAGIRAPVTQLIRAEAENVTRFCLARLEGDARKAPSAHASARIAAPTLMDVKLGHFVSGQWTGIYRIHALTVTALPT